jgi:hypothetical protein
MPNPPITTLQRTVGELSTVYSIFKAKAGWYNCLILRALAKSSGPLSGYDILGEVKEYYGRGSGTVYLRIRDLLSQPKPVIRPVGSRRSRSGKMEVPIYDLTLRGGIAALLLLDESEFQDYCHRIGWGLGNETLETVKHLATNPTFRPIAFEYLAYCKSNYSRGLSGLDEANDFYLKQGIRKNLFETVRRLRTDSRLGALVGSADEWLQREGLPTLDAVPWPPYPQ